MSRPVSPTLLVGDVYAAVSTAQAYAQHSNAAAAAAAGVPAHTSDARGASPTLVVGTQPPHDAAAAAAAVAANVEDDIEADGDAADSAASDSEDADVLESRLRRLMRRRVREVRAELSSAPAELAAPAQPLLHALEHAVAQLAGLPPPSADAAGAKKVTASKSKAKSKSAPPASGAAGNSGTACTRMIAAVDAMHDALKPVKGLVPGRLPKTNAVKCARALQAAVDAAALLVHQRVARPAVERAGAGGRRPLLVWVDDVPANNVEEVDALRGEAAELDVRPVLDCAAALAELAAVPAAPEAERVVAVITDSFRPDDGGKYAAHRLLDAVRAAHARVRVLVYCNRDALRVLPLQASHAHVFVAVEPEMRALFTQPFVQCALAPAAGAGSPAARDDTASLGGDEETDSSRTASPPPYDSSSKSAAAKAASPPPPPPPPPKPELILTAEQQQHGLSCVAGDTLALRVRHGLRVVEQLRCHVAGAGDSASQLETVPMATLVLGALSAPTSAVADVDPWSATFDGDVDADDDEPADGADEGAAGDCMMRVTFRRTGSFVVSVQAPADGDGDVATTDVGAVRVSVRAGRLSLQRSRFEAEGAELLHVGRVCTLHLRACDEYGNEIAGGAVQGRLVVQLRAPEEALNTVRIDPGSGAQSPDDALAFAFFPTAATTYAVHVTFTDELVTATSRPLSVTVGPAPASGGQVGGGMGVGGAAAQPVGASASGVSHKRAHASAAESAAKRSA